MKIFTFFSNEKKSVPVIQYLAMLAGTLNSLSYGMHYGWPSPSLPILLQSNSTIPMTDDEGSWVVVIILAGTLIGTLISLVILGMFGRKKVILFASLPLFAAWIMVAYAKSIGVLLAARLIAGTTEGFLYCALVMYLGEISDPRIRGLLSTSITSMRILGILIINVIGAHLTIRTTALVSSVVPVLSLITFCWMPESPYYFIKNGEHDKARKSLRTLQGREDVEPQIERMVQAFEDQTKETASWKDLFRVKCNRKALLVNVGIRIIQQLSGNGAITFYAQSIFQEAQSGMSSSTAACIYFAIQLVSSGCSSMLIDKAGRKPLMIISITGSGFALLTEGVYFYTLKFTDFDTASVSWIPIAALIFYVVAFSVGMLSIPSILLGEVFATGIKVFAVCVVNMFCNVGIMATSKVFQVTKDAYGMHVPFFIFALSCLFGLFFINFVVPETKGKTLEEIQLHFKGHKAAVDEEHTAVADR